MQKVLILLFLISHSWVHCQFDQHNEEKLSKKSNIDFGYKSKNVSFRTKSKLGPFKKAERLEARYLGNAAIRSSLYQKYEKVFLKASKKDLTELCKHPNNIIRVYAFMALNEQKTSNDTIANIVKEHLKDTNQFNLFRGCLKTTKMVGDEMLNLAKYQYDILSGQQEEEIDSLLFWQPGNAINSRYLDLSTNDLDESRYNRLHTLVYEEHELNAFETLIRYKRKSDIDQIPSIYSINKEIGIIALKSCPLESMVDSLLSFQLHSNMFENSSLYIDLYQAALNYSDSSRQKLLTNVLINEKDEKRRSYLNSKLAYAISSDSSSYLIPLKFQLLEDGVQMSTLDLERLWKIDSNRVYHFIDQTLKSGKSIHYDENTYRIILLKCESYLNDSAVEFILTGLEFGSNTLFIEASKKYTDPRIDNLLIKKFNTNSVVRTFTPTLRAYLNLENEIVYKGIADTALSMMNRPFNNYLEAFEVYSLAYKCEPVKTNQYLVELIQSSQGNHSDFAAAIQILLKQSKEELNQQLVAIYRQGKSEQKPEKWKEVFSFILKSKQLITEFE